MPYFIPVELRLNFVKWLPRVNSLFITELNLEPTILSKTRHVEYY